VLAEIEVEDDELVLAVELDELDELACDVVLEILKTLAADCCVRPVVGFAAVVFFDVSA
jgi:hypothetical protein